MKSKAIIYISLSIVLVATPAVLVFAKRSAVNVQSETRTSKICPLLSEDFRKNEEASLFEVLKLQYFLNNIEKAKIPYSGKYDLATINAVKNFQSKYMKEIMNPWGASQPSGDVNITTRRKIEEIYCGTIRDFAPDELKEFEDYKIKIESMITEIEMPFIVQDRSTGEIGYENILGLGNGLEKSGTNSTSSALGRESKETNKVDKSENNTKNKNPESKFIKFLKNIF